MLILTLTFLTAFASYLGIELAIQTNKQITLHQWLHPNYYKNEFPENDFPCRKNLCEEYQKQVAHGYAHMRNKRVVVTCLGRNIAHNLEAFSKRLEATCELFKESTVIIFENDSNDESRDRLKEWAARNPHIKLLELADNKDCILNLPEMYSYGSTSPKRIQKMSWFRNLLLAEVKKNYADYDYMMVIDMDIKGPWSHDGIAHTMGQLYDWDATAAYGIINMFGTAGQLMVMYDVLAYVPYQQEFNADPGIFGVGSDFFRFNFKELLSVKRGDAPIRVRSAFGGITFYKIPSILDAEYVPTRCEHIGLHDSMTANGHDKIYMNPNLIILAGLQGPANPFAEISIFPKKAAIEPIAQTA